MEDLDQEWISLNNTACQTKDSFPSTLGLTNMAGILSIFFKYSEWFNLQ